MSVPASVAEPAEYCKPRWLPMLVSNADVRGLKGPRSNTNKSNREQLTLVAKQPSQLFIKQGHAA